ncbi:beta-N-acetylhexosaminidase [Paenarthrobacter sp. AB444]|uniref:beta-N-acetylhexosaminidase n=1 Tax=Paenarthrobacter sp. AB444 TaxID=3025681 RepID=UPI002365ED01|nr:beta-N-acetylhexosaminidase [Paenarthrobacter sp. AB444]MDD7833872.1 beta-N-acetylhexosaminidase [Paenarthrobacter sp. AB444]
MRFRSRMYERRWWGLIPLFLFASLLTAQPAAAADSATCVRPVLTTGCSFPTQYTGTSTRPKTIPALRNWTAGLGAFQLTSKTRLVMKPTYAMALQSDADVFADDLEKATGKKPRVVVTDVAPSPGDILLTLGSTNDAVGAEGYELRIGSSIEISAVASAGAFYGTRTVLQLLHQGTSVPAGVAIDWPRYPERGLMIDIARNPSYSKEWLEERIRELAYLKLNYLHLHLTDDQGWRVESNEGLQSDVFLTKDQVRDLVSLAGRYHITVVPEVDMPGHMGWALRAHPEWQLRDGNGIAVPNKIDYSITEARAWIRGIVLEYLPLFPGNYWHMGSDEFLGDQQYDNYPQLGAYAKDKYGPLASPKDGVRGLMNEINALVRAHGKTLRVWNDNFTPEPTTVPVDTDVIVEWWADLNGASFPSLFNPATPQQLLAAGYTIQNSSFYPTYDYNAVHVPKHPSPVRMYEDWAVQRFHGFLYSLEDGDGEMVPFYDTDPAEKRNRGSVVHFWNDGVPTDYTAEQTAESIYPRLRVMAQKTWESGPLVTTYGEFASIMEVVGSAP